LLSIISLFTDYDFIIFLQDIEPAPLARTISYNTAGPISALGFQSPTLSQLMSRYATLDPILISSASDKKEGSIPNCSSSCQKEQNKQKIAHSGQNALPS
jgi:hypothetical protein